jgi:hypothetical protein
MEWYAGEITWLCLIKSSNLGFGCSKKIHAPQLWRETERLRHIKQEGAADVST